MSTVHNASSVTSATPGVALAMPEGISPYSISAEAFRRMIDADIFADDDRVELWDGWISTKMAKKRPHNLASNKVSFMLGRVIPPSWIVGNENPIQLNQARVPLPDLVLLRGGFNDYVDRDPAAIDVGLIIELSDSSLRFDTTTKLAAYAEAGIPAYWVVNLVKNLVQTYEAPIPAERRYDREMVYAVGQAVPLRLDGVLVTEIPALDLLPIRG